MIICRVRDFWSWWFKSKDKVHSSPSIVLLFGGIRKGARVSYQCYEVDAEHFQHTLMSKTDISTFHEPYKTSTIKIHTKLLKSSIIRVYKKKIWGQSGSWAAWWLILSIMLQTCLSRSLWRSVRNRPLRRRELKIFRQNLIE